MVIGGDEMDIFGIWWLDILIIIIALALAPTVAIIIGGILDFLGIIKF